MLRKLNQDGSVYDPNAKDTKKSKAKDEDTKSKKKEGK